MLARSLFVIMLQLSATIIYCGGADTNASDKLAVGATSGQNSTAAAIAAIAKGDLTEVKRLDKYVDLVKISNLNDLALNGPNAEVISYLRDKGRISASDMQIAAVRGNVAEVRELLKRNHERAITPGSVAATTELSDLGRSLYPSNTPLRLAIRRGNTEVVRALIAGGANVNERLFDVRRYHGINEFPLSEAVQRGNSEIIRILIEGGAILEDPPMRYSQKDPRANLSEFYKTHLNSPKPFVEKKLKEMRNAGLIVEEHDPEANVACPLLIAIRSGRAKNVSALLKAGANPNVLIGVERRPLHEAIIKGNPVIVQILIEKGADVNALTSKGASPLTYAEGYQQGDIADILRAAGAK